jgi:hypothetical protein
MDLLVLITLVLAVFVLASLQWAMDSREHISEDYRRRAG